MSGRWITKVVGLATAPELLAFRIKSSQDVRVGLVAFKNEARQNNFSLAIDTRPGVFNRVTHNVSKRLTGRVSGNPTVDVCFAWRLSDSGSENTTMVKYFRVYRDGNFLGVTNAMIYVDKDFELKKVAETGVASYEVKAVSQMGDIVANCQIQVDLA